MILKLSHDFISQINLKITFPENYPNDDPIYEILDKQSILIPKNLIADVQNKLSEYEKKIIENNRISKIELVEDLISELLEMTEKTKFTSVFSEQEKESAKLLFNNKNKIQEISIIPYPKTSSFTWNPNGQILAFQYNKIDFTQLKQSDKTISYCKDLEDWVKFSLSKDRNKFFKSENKLIEDDNNSIIFEKLRDLVDWKDMGEMEDAVILNSINKIESLPNLFMNNVALDIQQDHFSNNINKNFNLNLLIDDVNLNNNYNDSSNLNGVCNSPKNNKKNDFFNFGKIFIF